MNNNRNNNNNNRRRGRGSNNRQQGGQQLNRIDSRARGNAPQMLEKYRKLAHDSHLNGDRVTEEYYLQFADHYFRVIADQRARQEEMRQPRPMDRVGENGEEYSEDDFFGDANSPYDRAGNYAPAGQSGQQGGGYSQGHNQQGHNQQGYTQPQGQNQGNNGYRGNNGHGYAGNGGEGGQGGQGGDGRYDRGRRPRDDRYDRAERQDRRPRVAAPVSEDAQPELKPTAAPVSTEVAQDAAERTAYEPAENPFVRGDRAPRVARGRKPRRDDDAVVVARQEAAPATEAATPVAPAAPSEPSANLDASMLPPAISRREEALEEAPVKPKRRTRRVTPPADDAAGSLETVN